MLHTIYNRSVTAHMYMYVVVTLSAYVIQGESSGGWSAGFGWRRTALCRNGRLTSYSARGPEKAFFRVSMPLEVPTATLEISAPFNPFPAPGI